MNALMLLLGHNSEFDLHFYTEETDDFWIHKEEAKAVENFVICKTLQFNSRNIKHRVCKEKVRVLSLKWLDIQSDSFNQYLLLSS